MEKDLSDYTSEEKAQIARTAKRNVHSECALILTAGTGLIAVSMSFLGRYTFLPIAYATNLSPSLVWIGLSLAISALLAWLHAKQSQPRIRRARDLDAAFLYQYQDKQRADLAAVSAKNDQ